MHVIMADENRSTSALASGWPHKRMGCHSSLIDGIQDPEHQSNSDAGSTSQGPGLSLLSLKPCQLDQQLSQKRSRSRRQQLQQI